MTRDTARRRQRSAGIPALGLLLSLVVGLVVAACGGSASPSPTSSPSPSSRPSASPAASPPGSAPGSVDPGASPSPWPGTTVLAVLALGAADGEIEKAGADLMRAAENEDPEAMWGAADGLARMIEGLMPNIDRLELFELTKPVAAGYRQSFPVILEGSTQIRDAITSGDADGVTAGFEKLVEGIRLYSAVREPLSGLVEQAIVQQRLLLN